MNLFKKSAVDELELVDELEPVGEREPEDEQLALEIELPAEPEPEDDPKPAKKGKAPKAVRVTGSGVPIWVLAVLGTIVVALGVANVVLRGSAEGKYTQAEIDDATRSAINIAQDISSWDYRTIESDTKHVLTETTGDFKAAYEKSAATLLATAPSQEAIVLGTASKAGVEGANDDGIRILVFLNQSTQKKGAEPSTDLHRLRLTMLKEDGAWKVAKLEVL